MLHGRLESDHEVDKSRLQRRSACDGARVSGDVIAAGVAV